MTTTTAETAEAATDIRDPAWVRVGLAIKEDRRRRGMTRLHLTHLVGQGGGTLSERTLAMIEQGRVECSGGVSKDAAKRAYTALGWTAHQFAKIFVDGTALHELPPANPRPRPVLKPAADLTGRVQVTHPIPLAKTHQDITHAVQTARTALIRLGVAMPALDGDTTAHRETAARMARQLITGWVLDAFADAEDTP